MRATIKDVAREAARSISTVSYAMNGKRHITEETRQHILNVARSLNYIPNGSTKPLSRQKTYTIGVFFDQWLESSHSTIIRKIEQYTATHGYSLIACSLYGGHQSTGHRYLREKMVDGAIVLSQSLEDDFLTEVASENFPIVVMDRNLNGDNIYNVSIDCFGGAFNATRTLVEKGLNNVFYLGDSYRSFHNKKKLEGFIAALDYCGHPFDPEYIIHCDDSYGSAYEAISILINKGNIPKGIFCSSDNIALGAMQAANSSGVKIPDQMKLIGFGGTDESQFSQPGLSTVSFMKHEAGLKGAECLLKAIDKKAIDQSVMAIPTQLICRESL